MAFSVSLPCKQQMVKSCESWIPPSSNFFYVVSSSEETSFWPPSMVYISAIITHYKSCWTFCVGSYSFINESASHSIIITTEIFLATSRIRTHRDRESYVISPLLYLQATMAGWEQRKLFWTKIRNRWEGQLLDSSIHNKGMSWAWSSDSYNLHLLILFLPYQVILFIILASLWKNLTSPLWPISQKLEVQHIAIFQTVEKLFGAETFGISIHCQTA